MIDLQNPDVRMRVFNAVEASDLKLSPFRRNHVSLVEDFVGPFWGRRESKKDRESIVNLINQAAETWSVFLVPECPRILISTRFAELYAFGEHFQLTLNNFLQEIHAEEVFQEAVINAFFSIGIIKIFTADAGQIELDQDVWVDPGRPYMKSVSIDDWGCDMSAKRYSLCRYAWDRYRVPVSDVKANDLYDEEARGKVHGTRRNEHRDGETTQDLGAGSDMEDEEYEPMVDLFDLWLPREKLVATLVWKQSTLPPLIVRPWNGPENGPYRIFGFGDVPDNIQPLAMAQQLKPLADLFNSLYRKLASQAKRQKANPVYEPSAEEDANRLKKVADGVWTMVKRLQGLGVFRQGGIDQQNLGFAINVLDHLDRQAGNLQAMAGLGPQAETLGQDQLIHGQVNERVRKYQNRVASFQAAVAGDLGHLLWHDQVTWQPNRQELYDTGIHLDSDLPRSMGGSAWTPEDREGDWWQYNFQLDPYRREWKSPSQRIAKLEQVLGLFIQLLPFLQQSGGDIDVQEMVELYADLLDLPRLRRIITFQQMPLIERPGPAEMRQAPHTVREEVRRNVSMGGTPQNRSLQTQQALFKGGAGPQDRVETVGGAA